jgi:hypothetical protein
METISFIKIQIIEYFRLMKEDCQHQANVLSKRVTENYIGEVKCRLTANLRINTEELRTKLFKARFYKNKLINNDAGDDTSFPE